MWNGRYTLEVMKIVELNDILLDFCNRALRHRDIPDQWRHLNIVPVPKKGNLTKADNYSGIAISSVISKTLNRIIMNILIWSLFSELIKMVFATGDLQLAIFLL